MAFVVKSKQETIIKIICILILIILNLVVYLNGRTLSCNNCEVRFTSELFQNKQEFSVNISKLYESYLNNSCYIRYTKQGFIKNG